ncbi:MAG: hypothetical protein ABSE68_00630 [Minisyncoccia bacterium]
MKRFILPIFCGILILQPILMGGPLAVAADKPVPGSNTISVWVTAYSSSLNETDDTPFITATNKKVRDGFMAANFLPFGTRVRIPELFGDKIFIIEDRMSRRKTNFVDVWMPAKNDALEFGIHQAKIEIVEMGTIPNPLVASNDKNSAQD